MINKVFPLKLHLHVLQLEGYEFTRFIKWIANNYFVRTLERKKPLVWTQKVNLISKITILYLALFNALFFILFSWIGLLLSILVSTQTYLFLTLSVITLKPYEYLNRQRVKNFIKTKISKLKSEGLIVIGITGSFGKTTTKEFLYEILKNEFKVLKTPESYNTLFGIYKVVDLELSRHHKIFICEMGAYCRGEIAELCDVILPDHGILTGINEQHLERFGSIQNTIKAKFELIQALPTTGFKILNADNGNVLNNFKTYVSNPIFYGEKADDNYYKNVEFISGELSLSLYIDKQKIELSNVTVMGRGNISNLLASAVLAKKLGVSEMNIKNAIKRIKPVAHRLEVKNLPDITLIDDAYSSNVEGFKVALELLASYTSRNKILVTPGIVELGDETTSIHQALGKIINNICDYVLLVGDSERTQALETTLDKSKIRKLTSIIQLKVTLDSLNLENPVVLIENDLPENY